MRRMAWCSGLSVGGALHCALDGRWADAALCAICFGLSTYLAIHFGPPRREER